MIIVEKISSVSPNPNSTMSSRIGATAYIMSRVPKNRNGVNSLNRIPVIKVRICTVIISGIPNSSEKVAEISSSSMKQAINVHKYRPIIRHIRAINGAFLPEHTVEKVCVNP